jgi:hypothetical protein
MINYISPYLYSSLHGATKIRILFLDKYNFSSGTICCNKHIKRILSSLFNYVIPALVFTADILRKSAAVVSVRQRGKGAYDPPGKHYQDCERGRNTSLHALPQNLLRTTRYKHQREESLTKS